MAYIGNQPVLTSSEFREQHDISTTTTTIHTNGFHKSEAHVEVFRNGVLLSHSGDYTLNADGTSITLTNAAVNGDVITITGRRELAQGATGSEISEEIAVTTAGTTVTIGIRPLTNVHIYLNGVKLTTTGGSPDATINAATGVITFASAVAVGDVVAVMSRDPSVSNDIQHVTHLSTLTSTINIPAGTNTAMFGDTDYQGTININGMLVHAHGAMNIDGATVNLTGTLNIV